MRHSDDAERVKIGRSPHDRERNLENSFARALNHTYLWMPTGSKSVTEAMLTSKSSNIYVYSSGNEWAGSLENLVNQQHGTELPISSRDALKEWE